MITAKINVSKIDKTKMFTGEKGTYLDIVLIPTPDSKYGDYMIVQSLSKEDRDKGLKGEILGNGKNLTSSRSTPRPAPKPAPEDKDDVPF